MDHHTEIIASSASQPPTERYTGPLPTPPSGSRPGEQPLAVLEDPIFGAERLERIGGGGFGEVWRVRYLGSEEAWKYIPIRPGSSERTGREAIHARRVDHQNVVRVLDVLKLPDHYVLRMELVRGRDFSRVVNEDGVIPPDDAVAYGLQVASALAHAHRQGVAHLDLKPHNLILTSDGARVMVTDFGISASLARDWGDPPDAAGTPFFMAPEQFSQPPAVGSGIDIWSLGVTLYWSMSLSYPFKFDGREPREVIREDPPIRLSEVAPHVPPGVCRLISRMLEKDPERRQAGMEEVLSELEALRRAPGDPSARAGDRAFALCLFDEALARYEEASRSGPEGNEEAFRASSLIPLVREARGEHDGLFARLEARVSEDDLAGALLALSTARRRFSRSTPIRELRRRVETEIQNRFANPRRTVERELRRARFPEARRYLELLGALTGIPGARKLLRAAAGEEAVIDAPAIQRLRDAVERREAVQRQLGGAVEEAVQQMDFPRARDAMEELQNHFPLPENLERMRTFAAAAEALAFLSDYPAEILGHIAAREVRATAERPLFLGRAEARCNELLRAFNPVTYPRFKEIEELARVLSETIRALRARVGPEVEAIAEAHRRGDVARVRSGLEGAGDAILHTDVFSKDVQDVVRDIQKQLHVMVERADRLYREGQKSLDRRQFNKAITELEEALRLGGGTNQDIGALIKSSSESAEKRRRLAEDLHALDLAITGRAACMSDVAIYLEKAQDLLLLQEDPKQPETLARSATILTSAVDVAAKEIVEAPGAGWLDPVRELAAVIARVRPEFLVQVARGAGDLPDKLRVLVQAAVGRVRGKPDRIHSSPLGSPGDPVEQGALATHLLSLGELVSELSPLGSLLASTPAAQGEHPLLMVAGAISEFCRSCARAQSEAGDQLARQAAELLSALALLVHPPISEDILSQRKSILEGVRRRRIAAGAKVFLRRAAKFTAPLAVALAFAAVVVLAWFAGERKASYQALDAALLLTKRDPRWATVEGLAVSRGEDFALALRMIGNDLPAFGALDDVANPDARFWARCVAGAGLLSWIAPEGTPVLGRTAIRRAVESTLNADLNGAIQAWIDEAGGPFPRLEPDPGRGFPALLVRLDIADRVLGALGPAGGTEPGGPIPVRERVRVLQATAQSLRDLVDGVSHLTLELREPAKEVRERALRAFWKEYLSRREAAPSDGWRRLLDSEAVIALARELRENPPWKVTGLPGLDGPAALEALRLIARIRETSGPLPVASSWSEEKDPLFPVLSPIVW